MILFNLCIKSIFPLSVDILRPTLREAPGPWLRFLFFGKVEKINDEKIWRKRDGPSLREML